MKIVCQREALLQGVSIASNVAPSRGTRPILSGVKLVAEEKSAQAIATDLEVAVRSRLREVITEEPGEVVLTGQTLVEILRSIESQEVSIRKDGRFCEISAEDAHFKMVTDDPEDFPEVLESEEEGVSVPRSFVEEMFQRTAFSAARDVGRYAINGVLVEIGEGRIRFVATDGRRLAVASRDLPDATGDITRAIVPTKGLQECLRGSEGSSTIRLLVDERRVVFSSEDCEVAAKPVEGEFPDYAAVIPREHKGRVKVHRDVLLAAVRKVSVMAGDEMRAIHMKIAGGQIEISTQVEGRGAANTQVEVQAEGETEFAVDFNPDFIIDYLKPLPSTEVSFEFREVNGAGVFRLQESEDLYVLMPITTS